MSTNAHAGHDHKASSHHDDHGHEGGHPESTLGGYVTGFILSVILTAIPFWLVMTGQLGNNALTAGVILVLGAIQIVVHMIYFLHMTPSSEAGWSLMALIFTIVLVVITLSGSLWVMYHLTTNMMPMDPSRLP
jgi:cytochrome o ubiquinol oxidase subunit IV